MEKKTPFPLLGRQMLCMAPAVDLVHLTPDNALARLNLLLDERLICWVVFIGFGPHGNFPLLPRAYRQSRLSVHQLGFKPKLYGMIHRKRAKMASNLSERRSSSDSF